MHFLFISFLILNMFAKANPRIESMNILFSQHVKYKGTVFVYYPFWKIKWRMREAERIEPMCVDYAEGTSLSRTPFRRAPPPIDSVLLIVFWGAFLKFKILSGKRTLKSFAYTWTDGRTNFEWEYSLQITWLSDYEKHMNSWRKSDAS